MRIVSLLPSATEILFAVGAGEGVVGVSFECDYPIQARSRRVVSTTSLPTGLTPAEIDKQVSGRIGSGEELYRLDEDALRELQPDLIVTQDLCSVCAVDVKTVDDALAQLRCDSAVLTVDPQTLDEVFDSIGTIGTAVGKESAAQEVVDGLYARLRRIEGIVAGRQRPRVAVLEWTDPPFGPGHWIPDMVERAGGLSVVGEAGKPSRRLEWEELIDTAPEICVVSPCGYHISEARELASQLISEGRLPDHCRVFAADADSSFVRPGPRLIDGVEALAGIFHPEAATARPDLVDYVG